jgi:hypothetical protein
LGSDLLGCLPPSCPPQTHRSHPASSSWRCLCRLPSGAPARMASG